MKRKYRLISKELGNIETVVNEPEPSHLQAQIRYPSKVINPKKGKGSHYKRAQKLSPHSDYVEDALEEDRFLSPTDDN